MEKEHNKKTQKRERRITERNISILKDHGGHQTVKPIPNNMILTRKERQ